MKKVGKNQMKSDSNDHNRDIFQLRTNLRKTKNNVPACYTEPEVFFNIQQ